MFPACLYSIIMLALNKENTRAGREAVYRTEQKTAQTHSETVHADTQCAVK